MNERGKTEAPLQARDSVTRNVTGRFVSPLPPASILSTPNALKGRPQQQQKQRNSQSTTPQTARTSQQQVMMIAAPPNTARPQTSSNTSTLKSPPPGATMIRGGVHRNFSSRQQQQHQQQPTSTSSPSGGGSPLSLSPRQQPLSLMNHHPPGTSPLQSPLSQSSQQHQHQHLSPSAAAVAGIDQYDDDDNLPDDCPPSRRMEAAKRKLVQLSTAIIAAEFANEMRPELHAEIASKDIVKRLLAESTPHASEIRELLEDMASRAEENGTRSYDAITFNNNSNNTNNNIDDDNNNIHQGVYFDDDESKFEQQQEAKTRRDRKMISDKLSNVTDPGGARIQQQQHQKDRTSSSAYSSRRTSVYSSQSMMMSSSVITRTTQIAGKNKDLVPLMISMRPTTSMMVDGDDADTNRTRSSPFRERRSSSVSSCSGTSRNYFLSKSNGVDLQPDEDLDTSLLKEGKPMLIEISRGLGALQRALLSVVDVFDAISAQQQRAFNHYIDKWYKTASDILPTIESKINPAEFHKIKQFLVNTQKTATDSKQQLSTLSDNMFSRARDATSSIAVAVAESKDSLMKIQHVVNDLKAELALAGTLIPASLYNTNQQQQQQQKNTSANTTAASRRRSSPENSTNNNNNNQEISPSNNDESFSGSFSNNSATTREGSNSRENNNNDSPSASFAGAASGAFSAQTSAAFSPVDEGEKKESRKSVVAVSSSSVRHKNSLVSLPPPSLLNPYAGTTFVCVAVENLTNVVYPGCGKDYVLNSAVADNNNKLSEMSMLFAKHGAAAPFAPSSSSASILQPQQSEKTPTSNLLHSFTSGKTALSLIRSLVANTVTPCNGHIVAMRPFGPFLVAFDSVASAVTWTRGIQLYGSTSIPWPEDLLENPLFGVVTSSSSSSSSSKKTNNDQNDHNNNKKDPTGLERAINSGTMSAQVLMDSQVPPPTVNQMSITEDIFFNAWRSMLSDGAVVNGPGGGLAHKISRLSLLQMRETFNFLQRGRLFEKRGPQFKIGMSFESLSSVISSAKSVQNLQRGGGFRAPVAAATSLCAVARGGQTIATYDLANLFAESRNATSFDSTTTNKKSSDQQQHQTTEPTSTAKTNNTSKKTSSSGSSSIAVQAEEEGLKLLIAPPSKEDAASTNAADADGGALGVAWLPLTSLPERHRFTLRQCGTEKIFKVNYAPAPPPIHLASSASASSSLRRPDGEVSESVGDGGGGEHENENNNNNSSRKKTRQELEAERRRKQRKEFHHEDEADDNENQQQRKRTFSSSSSSAQQQKKQNTTGSIFDPASEDFDVLWFSRDDVTGGGGAAIVRPLQLSYLLPPVPLQPKLCTRECQSDPVCITISNNNNNNTNSATSTSPTTTTKRPSSPTGTTRILFSPDGTTRNLLPFTETAYDPETNANENTATNKEDLQNIAGTFEGAIQNQQTQNNSNKIKNNNKSNVMSSPASSARRGPASPKSKRSGSAKKKKKKEANMNEAELKAPPVMVERGEQTMLDQNYSLCPGGSGGVFFRDSGMNSHTDNSNSKKHQQHQLYESESSANTAKLENNAEVYLTNEGFGGRDSLNDDSAAAVVDVCNLLEKLIHFLSGTSNFTDLLHGVSSFVGPLRANNNSLVGVRHQTEKGEEESQQQLEGNLQDDEHVIGLSTSNNRTTSKQKRDNEEEEQNKSSSSTWDLVADNLLQHLVARMTYPVPPAQSTTFRLVVAGIMACVAEFVRSVPEREAAATKERFKKIFGSALVQQSPSSSSSTSNSSSSENDENYENTKDTKNGTVDLSNDQQNRSRSTSPSPSHPSPHNNHQQQRQRRRSSTTTTKSKIDPSLKTLSVVASIAQLIKIAPLDSADEASAAAQHASVMHERIRRRSKANEAVSEQIKVGATMNSRRSVAASMTATVRIGGNK